MVPKWREVIKVHNNLIDPADGIADIGLSGIVQDPAKVYFLVLERLCGEEIKEQISNN